MPRLSTLTSRAAALRLCAGTLLLAPVAVAAQAPATAPAPAPAVQTPPPAAPAAGARRLTLDEALGLAEGGSEQVAAAEAGVRRADGQIDLTRSGLYPQLNGAIGYTRTLQTQFDGIFDTSAAPTEPCAGLTVNP
ncbi:MAG TPA: hypothetical protein VMF13_21370, partial [Luteitalea sp.]|nr:hypothetical protein [Luteitalea sp.]